MILQQPDCCLQIIDRNQLMDAVSLDPRLKEEYKKVFVKLLEEQLDKNPRLGEVCQARPILLSNISILLILLHVYVITKC